MLTVSPGDALYSTFGHSAIRVVDPAFDLDIVFNYGTFDFNQPGFYIKFARGKLDYLLSAYRYIYAYEQMKVEQRSIIEQQLNLTASQRDKVFQFLRWNNRPENRSYRYDFFFDNCATRIRDVFEGQLGESLQLYYNEKRRLTFRGYLNLYLGNHPWSSLGINLGLGSKADRIAEPRDALFLPDFLYESFAGGRILRDGLALPLVAKTDTLLWHPESTARETSVTWVDFLFAVILVLVLFLSLQEFTGRWSVPPRMVWMDYLLYGLSGFVGLLIAFLWWGTDHNVTQNNWNLLWAWPTHLLALLMVAKRRRSDWMRGYFALALLGTAGLLPVWLFGLQELHPDAMMFSMMLFFRHAVNLARRSVS